MSHPDLHHEHRLTPFARLAYRALAALGVALVAVTTLLALAPALRLRVAAWLAAAPAASAAERVRVDHAVDGDTLLTADGRTVRIIGIDAPETHHPDMAVVQPFGPEAAARLAALVDGREVRLEPDVTEVDGYGRKLRHVWVGRRLAAETLAAEGLGYVLIIPPNVRHEAELRAAEAAARAAKRGLWGAARPTAVAAFATSPSAWAPVPRDPASSAPVSTLRGPEPEHADPPSASPARPPAPEAAPEIDPSQPCGARVAGAIPAESAGDFLDTYQAVEFTVVRAKDTGKVTFLNSHDPFQGYFYAAIFPTDYAAFPSPPAAYLAGKCIVVQGRVEMYRGAPQIVVRGAQDVRVIEGEGR